MKLKEDFGVRALMGTLVLIGGVSTLAYLAINGDIAARQILGDAVIAVVAFYYGIRKAQTEKGDTNGSQSGT